MLKIAHAVCIALVAAIACPVSKQAQAMGVEARSAEVFGGIGHAIGSNRRNSIYKGSARTNRTSNHGDWRQSFSPYWAQSVTTELVATAPAYFYYGIGHGDPYGDEVRAYRNDATAYCLLLRSYDAASGTYIGVYHSRYPCP